MVDDRTQDTPEVLERALVVHAGAAALEGTLASPAQPTGVIAFAHGSGSSRFSPRNRFVATSLQRRGFATFLLDLLSAAEEEVDLRRRQMRFDIDLLAERMGAAVGTLAADAATTRLPVGLFGASTGAAAALVAAARHPTVVCAVVSRGGRPDMAGDQLARVRAPTLLIVGERDTSVIELNRAALAALAGPKALALVPGATHLFEEHGALEEVAALAGRWFEQHLATGEAAPSDG